MTLILAQPAVNTPGSTDAAPLTYSGTGLEGNSFSIPGLAGKVLSQVVRQTGTLTITDGAAPDNRYIQYDGKTKANPGNVGTTFTLSAGDVVGAGELFLFYYYSN